MTARVVREVVRMVVMSNLEGGLSGREAVGAERTEEGAGGPGDDLLGKELADDEREGRAGVGEDDVVAADAWHLADDGLAVTRDGLGSDAVGGELQGGIAGQDAGETA